MRSFGLLRSFRPLVLAGLLTAPLAVAPAQTAARRPTAPATPAAAPDSNPWHRYLYWPSDRYWAGRAPDTVRMDVETTRGRFTIELRRAWAPHGVDRAYNLARAGFFDDSRVYRVIDGFVAQFGIAGDPAIAGLWTRANLPPDPRRVSNARGTVSFGQFTPNDRTTNLFINLRDNPTLDASGFTPIGRVVQGMAAVDRFYGGYGERPMAKANTARLYDQGNAFLDAKYPKLDRIRRVTVRTP